MPNSEHVPASRPEERHMRSRGLLLLSIVLTAAVAAGSAAGYLASRSRGGVVPSTLLELVVILVAAAVLYRFLVHPYYRKLEDANLSLHIKQEEILDTKDELFIKFLGVHDGHYAATSRRPFAERLREVADIAARVMGADVCLIYQFERKKDELVLAATNGYRQDSVGLVRIPAGQGIEGWVARRVEPVMLKDFTRDSRFQEAPGLALSSYASVYCLPMYVYTTGALMGVIEVLYAKGRSFSDEDINFFTTLSGILSTTLQNEQLQTELRKMNAELEQWVSEKIEELRASEERYRALVENANEAIFVLSEVGDIVFANEHAVTLSGFGKFDLVHKNLLDLLSDAGRMRDLLAETVREGRALSSAGLRRADGADVPVEVSCVGLTLIGKRFIQSVVRDMSAYVRMEKRLAEKDAEIAVLRKAGPS